MSRKRNLLVITLLLLATCCFFCFVGWFIATFVDTGTLLPTDIGWTDFEEQPKNEIVVPSNSLAAMSIYDDSLIFTESEKIMIPELNLAADTLDLLKGTSWSGDLSDPFPLDYNDYNQSDLQSYIDYEEKRDRDLTIPDEYLSLYNTIQSKKEISELVLIARNEYVDYLEENGIAQVYLDEINNKVFPADSSRIEYFANNDPRSPATATIPIDRNDNSELRFEIYDIDIHNDLEEILAPAGILGEIPTEDKERGEYYYTLRNISVRYTVYHEMTHVLQRAFAQVNVDGKYKESAFLINRGGKTLLDVDEQYHWLWGNSLLADSYNYTISQESQADGVAFDLVTKEYNFSDIQDDLFWEYYYGRYDDAKVELSVIKKIVESNYPSYSPRELPDMMTPVFEDYPGSDKTLIKRMIGRLNSLPAYIGYLNPVEEDDLPKLWALLAE